MVRVIFCPANTNKDNAYGALGSSNGEWMKEWMKPNKASKNKVNLS